MKKMMLSVCLILTVVGARSQQEVAALDHPKIDELLWMAGEWRAVEKTDGKELVVRLSARKSENGQALLYYVWFESGDKKTPRYNGMYYWDPAEKTFKMLQVNADGNVAQGTLEQSGNRVTQTVKTVTSDSSFELKSEWEIRPREFRFVGQFRPAGKAEWAPAVDVTYSRMGDLK